MVRKRRNQIVICLCLMVLGWWQVSANTITTDPQKLAQTERKLLQLLNGERTKKGLKPLKSDKILKQLALDHSRKMVQEQKLSHDFPEYKILAERMGDAGLHFTSAGENVSFSNTFVASYIHKGFMTSPPHRERILDKNYSHVGITIVESTKGFWVTQEFAKFYGLEKIMVMEANINHLLRTTLKGDSDFSKSFAKKYNPYTRESAKRTFLKKMIEPLPDTIGVYRTLKFSGSKSEDILNDLKKTAQATSLIAFSAGIFHGRDKRYPGGGYSVFIIMLPDLLENHRPAHLLSSKVLGQINGLRKKYNFSPLVISKELTTDAKRLAKIYYHQKNLHNPNWGVSVTIHLTHLPEKLSSQQRQFILSHKNARSLGLHLFYPPQHNLDGNYFLVTLVF